MMKFTRALGAVLIACCLAACTSSCASSPGSVNAVGVGCRSPVAENLQVCAYANYGTFVIMEELALRVAEEPSLSNDIRQRIIKADEVAKPVADSLLGAIRQYEQIRIEVAQGRTPQDKLLVATANLNRWVTEAAPLIQKLVDAVNSAAKGK